MENSMTSSLILIRAPWLDPLLWTEPHPVRTANSLVVHEIHNGAPNIATIWSDYPPAGRQSSLPFPTPTLPMDLARINEIEMTRNKSHESTKLAKL